MDDQTQVLNRYVSLAESHWREFLPKKYRRLQRQGRLGAELQTAAEETAKALDTLVDAGVQADEAWIQVRETYLLLPPEAEEELEPEDRERLQANHELLLAGQIPDDEEDLDDTTS